MESELFWRTVEGARAEAGIDTERVAQALLRRLRTLGPDEIAQFQDLWDQAQDCVYRWPIRDAATLLLGPLDDDEFLSVQDWIVSHGRRTVKRIQDDPDNVVELAPDRHNARIDWFCGLSLEAHMDVTGGTPFAIDGPPEDDTPTGAPVDLADEVHTRKRFPRLTAYLDGNPWIQRPWERAGN
ncbi:DUF4240 domain-containing protein [Actinoplanes aureus]|uniref:DUF4240 domain-containing protein n=1 Tax=Actinoplanes aureus TaxID=2792083 RepID=UPI0028151F68|nr:DUF4240 domain-containing protein [Actinoplanes aureus]